MWPWPSLWSERGPAPVRKYNTPVRVSRRRPEQAWHLNKPDPASARPPAAPTFCPSASPGRLGSLKPKRALGRDAQPQRTDDNGGGSWGGGTPPAYRAPFLPPPISRSRAEGGRGCPSAGGDPKIPEVASAVLRPASRPAAAATGSCPAPGVPDNPIPGPPPPSRPLGLTCSMVGRGRSLLAARSGAPPPSRRPAGLRPGGHTEPSRAGPGTPSSFPPATNFSRSSNSGSAGFPAAPELRARRRGCPQPRPRRLARPPRLARPRPHPPRPWGCEPPGTGRGEGGLSPREGVRGMNSVHGVKRRLQGGTWTVGWDRVPGGGTGSLGRDKEVRMGEVPRVRQRPQSQIGSPGSGQVPRDQPRSLW